MQEQIAVDVRNLYENGTAGHSHSGCWLPYSAARGGWIFVEGPVLPCLDML